MLGYEDLCGHGGARVYRRRAIVEARLRYWLRRWATGCCMRRRQELEYVIHVYEFECKDLGEDGRLYLVLLGRVFSAVMAQNCVGVVELSAAGVQRYVQEF